MSTSARVLRLLALLQTHRHWPGEQLADRLDVSVRTVRRDVDRLRELGYPVRSTPGVDGGYQLAPGAALPPLVLDDDEAVALAVGLQLAASAPVAGIAETSVRALSKVTQVMPARLTRQVEALQATTESLGWTPPTTVEPASLVLLAQTCRDGERVEFDYRSAAGVDSHRRVEPVRLVRLGARWYLVAYDLGRHDWRSFRLDRLSSPTATGERFRARELPVTDAAEFVRAGVAGARPTAYDIEVLLAAPAEPVRAQIGLWARVEDAGPDRCRVRMATDALEWVAFTLGRTGAELTVVSPPELTEMLLDWAGRFARAGQGADPRRYAAGSA